MVADFLSDKPLDKVEASSGEANARSNEKGELVLTVPQSDKEQVEIVITADNYRSETLVSDTASKQQKLSLVPARKHVFVSKRSGQI